MNENRINVFHHQSPNFGDYIALEIVKRLSGKNVKSINQNDSEFMQEHYVTTGSILTQINEHSIVWGTGLAFYSDKFIKAKEFRAVRGKLSLIKVNELGIACQVCGDPVLLTPELYKISKIETRYKLGIIPHWIDYYSAMLAYRDCDDVLIIDILKKPELIIEDLLTCEKTISSSLHGIILSHSYGIPCLWVKFSDKIIGDDFKYHDYFTSVNIPIYNALDLTLKQPIENIISKIINYDIVFNKKEFLMSCPFLSDEWKNKIK